MSDIDGVWPPKPDKTAGPEAKRCTNCNRPLLTKTSALCNWCGARIDDPEYQQKAAENRQARDAAERASIEELNQEVARYGVFGRLKRRAKNKLPSSRGNDFPNLES